MYYVSPVAVTFVRQQLKNKELTCIESCQIKFIATPSLDPPPRGPHLKNVITHSTPSPHPTHPLGPPPLRPHP